MKGKVYLIGAGPGDPGLITVKGLECIRDADVLVYDYLAPPALLDCARKDAEIIYVGKKGGAHTLSQEKINALLVEKAGKGFHVARLKGGDPFIFGRGGEEAEELVRSNIPFEVVPGVTSAIAAPAYAGIPLTHRQFTSTVAFVTGHEDPGKEVSGIDWEALAKGIGTLVFLMGIKNLPKITEQLTRHGMPPETPAALVRWGTTVNQETVTGTVATISDAAQRAGITAPAVIVIGGVVGLRDTLKWYENRPLFGKRIVVTRARAQASELVRELAGLGAECVESPTIEVVPVRDPKPLDDAIESLAAYDWIVFTSVNGVSVFFDRLFEKGRDVRALGNIRTACIGPATAERLRSFGFRSDLLPENYLAESIVDAFGKESIRGKKILIPRAETARPVLPEELSKMGAIVNEVAVYETREVRRDADMLIRRLREHSIDLVTFTSSSTVKNFKSLLPEEEFEALMKGVTVAAIGPITADTARDLGFGVHIVADTYTIPGLVEAILEAVRKGI
jgi:uroporphyrinogen III methyltransferase/synthase